MTVVVSGMVHMAALASASQLEAVQSPLRALTTISVDLIELPFLTDVVEPKPEAVIPAEPKPTPVVETPPPPEPVTTPVVAPTAEPIPATAEAANVMTTDDSADMPSETENTVVSDSNSDKLGSGLVSQDGLAKHGTAGAKRDGVVGGSGRTKRRQLPLSNAVEKPPKLLAKAAPSYPRRAKRRGMEGDIKIALIINERGSVARAKIISGPSIFHESVLAAVKSWRFTPPYDRGHRVSVRAFQTINFSLAN